MIQRILIDERCKDEPWYEEAKRQAENHNRMMAEAMTPEGRAATKARIEALTEKIRTRPAPEPSPIRPTAEPEPSHWGYSVVTAAMVGLLVISMIAAVTMFGALVWNAVRGS